MRTPLTILLASSLLLCQSCNYMMGEKYPKNYDQTDFSKQFSNEPRQRQIVTVPDSPSFAEGHSPIKHSDRDRNWIQQQTADHYTIEVKKGKSAAEVAKALQESPHSTRSAQYKYQDGSSTYYGGVYGTYPSKEEAEKALQQLPENIRRSAEVNSWKDVQSQVSTVPEGNKAP